MNSDPQLTWNLVRDVTQLFDYPFMVNAIRAGTIVAVTSAIAGWFMVLRRQAFAGHTLALVGFPGAAGAILLGVSATYGFFAFAVAAAVIIAAFSRSGRGQTEESAVIGTVQALALASGFLFVSLSGRNITGVQSLLFGSIIGVTDHQVRVLFIGSIAILGALAFVARPLFFASIDPDVAAARGVPVRVLGIVYLVLLAIAAAEASQVTGTLLVFALLVLPPATAELMTPAPLPGIIISVVIGLAVTWIGLALSYYTDYPIGFYITTLAFGTYMLAQLARRGSSLRYRTASPT